MLILSDLVELLSLLCLIASWTSDLVSWSFRMCLFTLRFLLYVEFCIVLVNCLLIAFVIYLCVVAVLIFSIMDACFLDVFFILFDDVWSQEHLQVFDCQVKVHITCEHGMICLLGIMTICSLMFMFVNILTTLLMSIHEKAFLRWKVKFRTILLKTSYIFSVLCFFYAKKDLHMRKCFNCKQ